MTHNCQARASQDGYTTRKITGQLERGLADIDIDVHWPSDMPAQAVLDQLESTVATVRRQIAAHQEQTND